MTIDEAIDKLAGIKLRWGNIQIYFDCPKCKESFAPNIIVNLAVHITDK